MCRRARDDVPTVLAAGGKVADLCGSPKRGYCPHHPKSSAASPCAHRLQRYDNEPIVMICGAEALTHAPPPTFNRKINGEPIAPFDLVVVDEIRLTGFLGGFGPTPTVVPAAALEFVARLALPKETTPSISSIASHRWRQLQDALDDLVELLRTSILITLGTLRRIELLPGEWRAMRQRSSGSWSAKPSIRA